MKTILGLMLFFNASLAMAQVQLDKVVLPDSWGIFECVHFRFDSTKHQDAAEIIQQMILDHLSGVSSTVSRVIHKDNPADKTQGLSLEEAKNHIVNGTKQLQLLYPHGDPLYPAAGDDYRTAVQNVLSQKEDLRKKYSPNIAGIGEKYNDFVFESQFDALLDLYYDQGNPKAGLLVDSIEKRHKAQKDSEEKLKAMQNQLNNVGAQFQKLGQQLRGH